MRREYPYLHSPYVEDLNAIQKKTNFLSTIDSFVSQKQYVRITLLNWNESPIKEIQGELTSGNITKDGSSSIRTTCSLSCSVNGTEYSIEDSRMDFAINKKIFIEVGIKNYSKQYPDYPILWFPQGVFFIGSFNISSSATSSVNISLSLKDKMAGLNGDVGGVFPATTVLDEVDTQSPTGAYISQKVLVYDIIQEVVHHWGGEDLNNIVIEDVPLRIKRVMKWNGDEPIWLIPEPGTSAAAGDLWYHVSTEPPTKSMTTPVIQITNGYDAGYIYDDFYYTNELTMQPGAKVTDALDQIKQYLGNYEYFYDEFGVFHFREIKNYMNTTQGKIVLDDMSKNDYLVEVTTSKNSYSFSDDSNLINITVNPQYENIKNDYIVQGKREMTDSDISYPVRYHLAIDQKPVMGNTYYDLLLYKEKDTGLTKAIFPLAVDKLPDVGNFNLIYRLLTDNSFVYWENDVWKEVECLAFYPSQIVGEVPDFFKLNGYTPKDWRTELFLQGLLNKNNGTSASMAYQEIKNNYSIAKEDTTWLGSIWRNTKNQQLDIDFYYEELDAFWPTIYDLYEQRFYAEGQDKTLYTSSLTDGNYYLDFIEPNEAQLGEFCVQNIGRRTLVTVNDDVNCLFQPEIPDIVFINIDDDDKESVIKKRAECQALGQPYTQVPGELYYSFRTGGYRNGAFEEIKYQLFVHTNYQKTLSLVTLPVFYLQPNTRVAINDKTTNTYGDFMVQSISLPLGPSGNMSVTCSECFERF